MGIPDRSLVISATLSFFAVSCATASEHGKVHNNQPAKVTSAVGGWLNVATVPPGVRVIVDGVFVGESPVRTRQTAGDRVVVLQHYKRNVGPHVVNVVGGVETQARFVMPEITQPLVAQWPKVGHLGRESMTSVYMKRSQRQLRRCLDQGWRGDDLERVSMITVQLQHNKAGRLLAAKVLAPDASASVDRCLTSALQRAFEPDLPGINSNEVDPRRTRNLSFRVGRR